jgi:hypothetical protein
MSLNDGSQQKQRVRAELDRLIRVFDKPVMRIGRRIELVCARCNSRRRVKMEWLQYRLHCQKCDAELPKTGG